MSKETLAWLNSNTLIGFADKRGNAWHYRASEQGAEANHYEGAIPAADVLRRLFAWQAVELPLLVAAPATIDNVTTFSADGTMVRHLEIPGRKAIARDDTMSVLGLFSEGYQPHQYDTWLIDNVCNLLSDSRDGLGIGSAGLLRGGAQAWVSVEVPENVTTPEGVTFRPNLLACTSFDGSLATTYKRVVQLVVCDNTLSAGLSEKGQQFRIKHTRFSQLRIADAQQALAIVHDTADDFSAEVARLCAWEVGPSQWRTLLDRLVPVTDGASQRSTTIAENKRASLQSLYTHDQRCSPWAGTAFGVLQAFNTYSHHVQTVRGQERAERNMGDVLTGRMAQADADVLATLAQVTGRSLVAA